MNKYIIAFTVIFTLCTLTACGVNTSDSSVSSVENVDETIVETSAKNLNESSDRTAYDSYEDALIAYYKYVADNDYDNALSVMMPEEIRSLITYMNSEDEIIEDFFYGWDINQKILFEDVISEESMDYDEKQEFLTMLDAELYCFNQIIRKYDQFPDPEEMEEELEKLQYQIMEDDSIACPDYISDIHKLNIHLTDSHDVDFYHTVVVYQIDGERWYVIEAEEDDDYKEDWTTKVIVLSNMGEQVWSAAADSLNNLITENKFGLAEIDWSQPFAISSDSELCFRFDKDAAKVVCEDIFANVEDSENYDFFIVLSDYSINDIIICSKDDHNNICITPSGCIDMEDGYENASDLTYEKACQLYLQNIGD